MLAHSREIEKETLEKETKLNILMTLATSLTTDHAQSVVHTISSGAQEKSLEGITVPVSILLLNRVQRANLTKVTSWSPRDVCPGVRDFHIPALRRDSQEESPKGL